MKKIAIWHNPQCSKSRNAMQLLEERGIDAEVIKYLDTPPNKEDIKALLSMLDIEPRALMRTKEEIYKSLKLADEKSDEKLIEAMVAHPKLIERPIVVNEGKAAIGRPIENIINILN